MTSGTGRTKGKGGGRRNHKINMAVKQVLVYLGLGHGETKERRYSERKEQLSQVVVRGTYLPYLTSILLIFFSHTFVWEIFWGLTLSQGIVPQASRLVLLHLPRSCSPLPVP
jgi:hypothetical protein